MSKTLTPKELHDRAMEFASLAHIARRRGKRQEAINYTEKALALEAQAARSLPAGPESEPTRSILFLGAASLAYQAGKYDDALRLIGEGISRHTPEETSRTFVRLREDIALAQRTEKP